MGLGLTPVELCLVLANNQQCFHPSAGIVCHPISRTVILGSSVSAYIHKGFHTPLKLFLPLGEFCFAPISTLAARHVDRTQSLVSDCWIRSLIIESSIIFPAVGASLPFEYGSRPYSGRALPCSCQQPTMLPSKCWDSLPPDISDCDSWLICERLHPQRIPHTVETVSSSGRILLCSDINAGSPARRSDSIVSQRLLDTFSHHRKLHHFSCSRGISAV
ncbi:uncharacterized protein LOC110677753 [Aedes aegypti]|uniref:Uncharacterized protein n=1 Tax=Aedes aegypti TaxID=7159 RepID=A0A6I8TZK3_AEDAE|nr:uncharacterized protein LOC110677753 [Aedes aegypti]